MTKLILAITFALLTTFATAQLKGSGRTMIKSYDYTNFDKVYFDDLDGKLEIEIGKPYSISVTIDDNLLPLLAFEKNEKANELKVYFKGNTNNNLYIEDTHLKIKITTPTALAVRHNGNSGLIVKGITGSAFEFENKGNASTNLIGTVTNLQIKNSGNGNVYADTLTASNATIKCTGNGNVDANVSEQISARASGNCSIRNKGKALFDSNSSKNGNARLISQK